MRYSQINLPKTKIADRSSLNMIPFNYFNYINKKKPMRMEMNMIDIEEKTQDEDVKLLNGFQTFLFEKIDEIDIESKVKYSEFLEKMIPKTRTLINAMKKYIKNGVSYFDILYYLQPFLVFSDDITFKQYEEIVNFMRQNILNYLSYCNFNFWKWFEYDRTIKRYEE